MKISRVFVRTLFVLLCVFFIAAYTTGTGEAITAPRILIGAAIGLAYGASLIGIEFLFRKTTFRTLNVVMVGLFFGYLLGMALVLILKAVIAITTLSPSGDVFEIIKIALFLFGTYLGIAFAIRSADELYISIPFVKFSKGKERGRDLLLDLSALTDPRLLDLTASGLVDERLILPRFVLKELYSLCEYPDEGVRNRGRQGLETVSKLEELPTLQMRTQDTDFVDVKELPLKLVRLARLLDANILTAETTPVQLAPEEGIRMVNLHTIATALKPTMQGGETLYIKIQRYGKEPRQGVGYLEDGAMVVVNGGGDYIGEEVEARVLSVKHTTAGKIIFCNVVEGEDDPHDYRSGKNGYPPGDRHY